MPGSRARVPRARSRQRWRRRIPSNQGLSAPDYRNMTVRSAIAAIFQQEELNFLLTNRIPRRLLTQLVGWFSQIEQPLVRDLSIGVWRFFSGLDLSEASSTQFRIIHDC